MDVQLADSTMPNVLTWRIVSARLESPVPLIIAVSFALVRLSHCQVQKLETFYPRSKQHSPRFMGGIIIETPLQATLAAACTPYLQLRAID
jgi:hypothetical protein